MKGENNDDNLGGGFDQQTATNAKNHVGLVNVLKLVKSQSLGLPTNC